MWEVVEELTILRYPGVYEKWVIHPPKTYIQHAFAQFSKSFQKFKLFRQVKDFMWQVVEELSCDR